MTNETETTAAARVKLGRFEAETQALTPEQVCIELGRHDWQVAQTMSEPDSTGYLVRKEWTLKGLRCHLASEQYLESLLPPEDDDTGSAPASFPTHLERSGINNPRLTELHNSMQIEFDKLQAMVRVFADCGYIEHNSTVDGYMRALQHQVDALANDVDCAFEELRTRPEPEDSQRKPS